MEDADRAPTPPITDERGGQDRDGPARRPGKVRDLCWTINNYTEDDLQRLRELGKQDGVRYLVWGRERAPTTGTPHLQGFIQFKNPRSWNGAKMALGQQAHLSIRRGSPQAAADYCKKDGDQIEEFGERKDVVGQGTRSDINEFCASLKRGSSLSETSADRPDVFVKFHRGIKEWAGLNKCFVPRTWKSHVIVLVGDAGVGKSRWAHDFANLLGLDAYVKPDGPWWDRYNQEKVVIIDDFHGNIPYGEFKKILDRFPYQVPVKGAFVEFNPDWIIITSNKLVCDWYSQEVAPWNARGIAALYRRLSEYYVCHADEWYFPWEDDHIGDRDCMRTGTVHFVPISEDPENARRLRADRMRLLHGDVANPTNEFLVGI